MLTNKQKAYLSRLAAEACARQPRQLQIGEPLRPSAETLARWRHEQVQIACGKRGLRCCSQADYKAVEAHFLNLLGRTRPAFRAAQESYTESRRQAAWKVLRCVEKWAAHGITLAYAEALSRRIHKCPLQDASEKQLWQIKFTLDAEGRRRRDGKTGRRSDRVHRACAPGAPDASSIAPRATEDPPTPDPITATYHYHEYAHN